MSKKYILNGHDEGSMDNERARIVADAARREGNTVVETAEAVEVTVKKLETKTTGDDTKEEETVKDEEVVAKGAGDHNVEAEKLTDDVDEEKLTEPEDEPEDRGILPKEVKTVGDE